MTTTSASMDMNMTVEGHSWCQVKEIVPELSLIDLDKGEREASSTVS